jgi:sulfatase maturation enzyme AslB (radical SAM superfamily)
MIAAPQFDSLTDMDNSSWLKNIKSKFEQNIFPQECYRCQQTENINNSSIRLNALMFDQKQNTADYLTIGGVLDNVCNSACFTCDAELSTKIGSLYSKIYPIVDNTDRFWKLPLHRVVHLDINGGEPSASKNYRSLLRHIPSNVKSVRINTNCSVVIAEIDQLINRGIDVTVTVSLDGIEAVHDMVRWPIKWDKFYNNLMTYKYMPGLKLNTWTTVSALNIGDLDNIIAFVNQHSIDHSYALLHDPDVLNIKHVNSWTNNHREVIPGQVAVGKNNQVDIDAFMVKQKQLRGMA